jgi:hypothetical protein
LFAAGAAVALLLGGASPAMAKPDNGKAKGHVNKPAKTTPVKKGPKANHKSGVSGGGAVELGTLSAQARMKHQPKGHFNYTSNNGSFKLRCRGFMPFEVAPSKPTTTVLFTNCATTTGAEPNQVRQNIDPVSVVFTDNGQPSEVPGAPKDSVTFTVSGVDYGGPLTDGNIKIR